MTQAELDPILHVEGGQSLTLLQRRPGRPLDAFHVVERHLARSWHAPGDSAERCTDFLHGGTFCGGNFSRGELNL